MKSSEMNSLVAYRVIKDSTDETFKKDDLIWMSEDGSVTGAGGFLSKEVWNQEKTNDFEVEPSKEYSILKTPGMEAIVKNVSIPFTTYKENWEELKERLEKAELELLKIRNNDKCPDEEQKRLDTKLSGLRIALEYMREMEK
jgi:hypothetical protein